METLKMIRKRNKSYLKAKQVRKAWEKENTITVVINELPSNWRELDEFEVHQKISDCKWMPVKSLPKII